MTASSATKNNYDNWCIQVKALLGSQDAWDVIEKGVEEPENPNALTKVQTKALKEARKSDKIALFIIYQAVEEFGFEKMAGAKSVKEAWETLKNAYKDADRVKQVCLQTLHGEFEAMKMKETKGVSEFITRIQTVVNQLKRNSKTLTDARVVEKMLRSLTDDIENVVCAIEESKNLEEMTIAKASSSNSCFFFFFLCS